MTLIMTTKEPLWKEQKQSWHKINPNLSDSAQLLFDSPAGYKLYISVSNAKSKRLCTHQQATEPAISLIVSRRGCLGSWPWCSWCHCLPLMNADRNSKAILKSSNITQTLASSRRAILLTQTAVKRLQTPRRAGKRDHMEKVCFDQGNHIAV